MELATVQTLIQLVGFLWIAFAVLLCIAAIMLVRGSKHRYGVGIVAFSLPAAISLVWIVGVGFLNAAALDIAVDKLGMWVSFIVPRLIEPTLWPWVVLVASAACIVALILLARREKRQQITPTEETEEQGDEAEPKSATN